ncbi:MFS general substrate transporter [Patellaria atrata CBS 101060]|uniref:MFS general substrate transporter n=1 Tax=Patellaria atrata CBS 101060 TaxID=1346257 RepID=A0A9P4VRZ4_9PEZI|nr:MFS general substrate transporter [Patellaria atrata CBS 101060]
MTTQYPNNHDEKHEHTVDVGSDTGEKEHLPTLTVTNFETDEDDLPRGYFKSSFFIGTMVAIGLSLMAGVAGFGYAAPILVIINADIGPDPNVVWVSLSYTLVQAVTFTIVGRVSDIFGRRWVFIGGAVLGVIGSIICATAQSINTLIGGTAIIGIAAATQLSYYYVMGELVPMKYRLAGNGFCYIWTIPGSGIAPAVAYSLIYYSPNVGWRGCYYILIAINSTALLCWVLFYHPPTFHMKHRNERMITYVKNFDYFGTVLYTGGLLILLMGLSWGGGVYPWNSSHVIATIVVGFVALVAFVVWESFAGLTEPLVPMHLFRNIPWDASVIVSGLGASIYYAFAIIWPSMVSIMYSDPNNRMSGPWLSSLTGLLIVIGEIAAGFCAKSIGKVKYQCIATLFVGGIFFACMATCGPDDRGRAAAFMSIGVFLMGWTESIAITMITICTTDQQELGSASGVAGSIRFLISSIAATVYTAILSNRLAVEIPSHVAPAVQSAGLPASSVAAFITAFSTGPAAFEQVPGITTDILAAGARAYQEGNAAAYSTVFLSTIAFTAVGIAASFFMPNGDDLMTGKIAATLHKRDKEDVVGS